MTANNKTTNTATEEHWKIVDFAMRKCSDKVCVAIAKRPPDYEILFTMAVDSLDQPGTVSKFDIRCTSRKNLAWYEPQYIDAILSALDTENIMHYSIIFRIQDDKNTVILIKSYPLITF